MDSAAGAASRSSASGDVVELNVIPLTSSVAVSNSTFLSALAPTLRVDEYLWVCAFRNDPHDDDVAKWRGKEYRHAHPWFDGLVATHNQYFSVAVLRGGDEAGRAARRKPFFSRLMALVADDFHVEDVRGTPTWVVQTSPASSQVGFAIDPHDPDSANARLIDALMDAMSTRGLIKGDPSGNNLVRYVRLPNGMNTKKRASGDYRTQLRVWNAGAIYSLQDAAAAIGIDIDNLRSIEPRREPAAPIGDTIPGGARNDTLASLAGSMRRRGMSASAIEAALLVENLRCDPPMSETEVRTIAQSVGRYAPEQAVDLTGLLEKLGNDGGFLSAATFAQTAQSPDYVVDGLLRRGYLYSLTGMSNAGKTSIGLRLVKCVDNGTSFGAHPCVQGRCLILAGENPDDVAYRFLAEAQHEVSSVERVFSNTTVLPFSFAIEKGLPFIQEQAKKAGGYTFVLVDSKAAYFGGDSEDDNAQAYRHAKFLRELTQLLGRPTVLVVCHPIKRPESPDQLLPRGGSAFLNEIDGNLTAWRESGAETVRLSYTKIRGIPFDPVDIRISIVELHGLKTSSGKAVTSVLALPIGLDEVEQTQQNEAKKEDLLLGVIYDFPKASQRVWAERCGWVNEHGKAKTGTLSRVLAALSADKLVSKPRKSKAWRLTEKGRKEAEAARGDAHAESILGGKK